MLGLGTIINCGAILLGATVGIFIKKGISERIQKTVVSAIGLAVMFIGLSGTLSNILVVKNGNISVNYILLTVISLALGGFLGEVIDIEKKLEKIGNKIKSKLTISSNDKFVEGFVSSSLLFCVGAMAILGALQDGLFRDYSTLLAKSVLDGVMSIVYTASFGVGVYFSFFTVLIYQGIITLLAGVLKPFLTSVLIAQFSAVGNILIFAIGINLVFGKKIKVGNLLPSILMPIIYNVILLIIK